MHELKDLRGKDDKGIELVINMQGMATSNEVPKKDIEKAMELKISAMISFLPKLFMGSESESKKIIADKDGELVVKMSVLPVLQKVLDADIPQNHGQVVENTGFLSSLMGKLKAKK